MRSQRRNFLYHWAQLGVPSGALHCGSPAPPLEECSGSLGALPPSSGFLARGGHGRRHSGRSQAWPSAEMTQTLGWQPTDARDQTWCVYGSSLTDAAPQSGGGARRSSSGPDLCRAAQRWVKDLARAGISQRFWETETQATSPRTQMGCPGVLIKAAGAGPILRAPGPEGPTNFGAVERQRWVAVGGWSREPLLSSTCSGSASSQPSPTPLALPPATPAIRLLSSPLPPFSPPLPDSPTFLWALLLYSLLPHRPARLLPPPGPQGRRRARCTLGQRAARREAYFPLLLGNLERVCVRARVSCRRKRVESSGEQRVRVFDVSRPLHKPRGARKSVSESACVYTGWLPLAHSVARGPGARRPLWRPGITVTSH